MSLPRQRRYRSACEWPSTPAIDSERWTITPQPDDDAVEASTPPDDDQPEDWCFPPTRQVSPVELAMMAAGVAIG
jgi:hypothetical protein